MNLLITGKGSEVALHYTILCPRLEMENRHPGSGRSLIVVFISWNLHKEEKNFKIAQSWSWRYTTELMRTLVRSQTFIVTWTNSYCFIFVSCSTITNRSFMIKIKLLFSLPVSSVISILKLFFLKMIIVSARHIWVDDLCYILRIFPIQHLINVLLTLWSVFPSDLLSYSIWNKNLIFWSYKLLGCLTVFWVAVVSKLQELSIRALHWSNFLLGTYKN